MNRAQLEHVLGEPIVSIKRLSGGDIANAQRVDTHKQSFFVKSGSFPNAKALFEQEAVGLKALKNSKTVNIPQVIGTHSIEGTSCLVLEFIKTKRAEPHDMEVLGRKLAHLHLSANTEFFGFKTDNFIGKLAQSNRKHQDWSNFYIEERLQPQFKFARDQNLLDSSQIPNTDGLIKKCTELFGVVAPSLLHGDLWGGNYLIGTDGTPYLIDPAVYFGHNEVDLAMTKLFGGFSDVFYEAYHEIIPPHENQKELTEIYQLYYLLVHLNLFGSSYLNSVLQILRKYFQ